SFLSHYDALLLYLHSFPTRRSSDLKDTLKGILDKSSHSIDYFFNKRGTKFKELGLKERLHDLSEEEKLELLASDGMLIKRPMVVLDDDVLLGFKEETYKNALLN